MLRQSGAAAGRLLCGNAALLQQGSGSQGNTIGSRLLWSAMQFSSQRAAGAEGVLGAQAASGLNQECAQLSASAAAALAAKRPGLIAGGMSLLRSSGKPFSARGLATSTSSAAPAAAATASSSQGAQDKYAGLKKVLKMAAAVAAALGLTAGSASADVPGEWQYLFQDTASSTAQAAIDLHHDIMFFVITILALVFYMFFQIATKFHYTRVLKPEKLTHHTTAEVIWTVIPTMIVVLIAIPSLTLIYSLDQHTERPGLTVKVVGRQWYWSYEMHDHLQHKLLDPDRMVAIAEKALDK